MKNLIILCSALFVSTVWADQCMVVSKEQAQAAKTILSTSSTAYEFCQPCRDRAPQKLQIASVKVLEEEGKAVVLINGNDMDLAYLYDSTGKNVGLQVGCDAQDVSEQLEL